MPLQSLNLIIDNKDHFRLMYIGENYLIPCWFCTFAYWQRNVPYIILMVGLFEQWETEQQQKNPEKRISKKL